MVTRSTIAIERQDGTVAQVYCHWDGYLSHNGRILQESYKDAAKIEQLIAEGDVSSLGAEIGVKRPFQNPNKYGTDAYNAFEAQYEGQCLFYARDRGEEGTKARVYKNYAEYRNKAQFEEYNYCFRNGAWEVEFYGEFDGLLTEALEREEA